MKVIASDYAVAAAILHIHGSGVGTGFDDTLHSFTVEQLSERLSRAVNPEFDPERTHKLVEILTLLGVGEFFTDPFADQVFQVSDSQIQSFLNSRARSNDIFARAWNLGIDWIKTAFDKPQFWVEFDKEQVEFVSIVPPADDELFPLDHNSKAFEDASDALDKLSTALDSANDLGDLSETDLGTVREEIAGIRDELKQDAVKLPDFGNRARLVLGWVAKEAAGAAIGALAIAAFMAIIRLITIPF